MSQSVLQKMGNQRGGLILLQGGRRDRTDISPEQQLIAECRDWANRGKVVGESGFERYATRAIENMGCGASMGGFSVVARTIRKGLEAELSTEWALDGGRILIRYTLRRARANGRLVDLLGAA